jgi:hypothetical protein
MLFKVLTSIHPNKSGGFKVLFRNFICASVFILCVSGVYFAPDVITQLNFNEGVGTTTSDLSGNDHNGTLVNGPVWTEGKYEQGVTLDGTNDYVNIADHADFTLDPAQSYTWSGWVKNNNFTEWGTVWSQTVNASNFFYFYAHTSTDQDSGPVTNGVSVVWWTGGGANKIGIHSTNNVLTAGQWSYIGVTYNAGQTQNNRFSIYVNGVDLTNRTDVVSTGTITTIDPVNIRIGSNQPFGEYLNGSVDEVRYYRRLVSVAEMQSDMNTSDTQAPAVSITAPSAGNVSGTINITGDASDNAGVAGVQFLLNGANLGAEDLVAPYSLSWNTRTVANGAYILTAKARDAAGNITTSDELNITVNNLPDTEAPTVSIISPTARVIANTINVIAKSNDNVAVVGVQFLLNGSVLGAEDLNSPYSFSWNTATVANGNYVLTARSRDAAGNITTSTPVVVYVNNDTQAPVVAVDTPASSLVSGTINVTATATDNVGIGGVQFLLDGANLGTEDITFPYSVAWNTTTIANGNHTLTARARDTTGNTTTSAEVIVIVNNDHEPPVVTITTPSAGIISGTINVNVNATDNVAVAGVQFMLNGSNLGPEDLTAPYSFSWNSRTVANGTYILTAKARDAAGNITTSNELSITVSNPPDTEAPTVSIISPTARLISHTINVIAKSNDNAAVVGVQFLLNGSELGSEDLNSPYSFSWNTLTVANGNYRLTAKSRDAAGNTTTSAPVYIYVNNPPDTELPTISITAPAAGNVSGTINVTADANDNYGVVAVQFLLDGTNLGAEDIAVPYSVSWNTTTTTPGNHILTAKARDRAGNTTTAASVNIIVIPSNPPVISGISVSSITSGSAVIKWTTNVPTNSQVKYGPTTTYGLSTLLESTLVSSHSQILNGLVPGTLYHYQILSTDVNGILATSADNSFTTVNLSPMLGTLNGHTVLAYPAGKIIPWTSNPTLGYDTVMKLAWNYLLNSVPNDPATGKPAYYSRSYINPNTQQMVDWPHNPAGLYAMLVESALKYYAYSGNANVMQLASDVAIWQLDHGMTLTSDNWPRVPYSSGDAGSLNYGGAAVGNDYGQGDGVGYLQPDKIGELGYAWLQLYKYNGNARFRDAAIQAANVLSNKIRVGSATQSPWPFRVNAHTGEIREQYCSNIIAPISLLDGLIASGLGNTIAYQAARTTAWNWMMTYPMQNNIWSQYFEDISIQTYNTNLNQLNAMMVARYLLEHPEFDPNWETHVRGLISWVESTFGQAAFGATVIREQQVFLYAMGSHSSRYASVNALLYEKTGDLAAKEKAYRSFNWATYMTRGNGVVIDGPEVNNQWFTDGYGDYVRHFMTGLGAVPEWTPSNQTHLLRSSSVVKNIFYGNNSVNYTTYDANAVDVLHVNFLPATVTANGVVLPQRTDLTQPGWMLDVATKTLRIYHSSGSQISISSATSAKENYYIVRRRFY